MKATDRPNGLRCDGCHRCWIALPSAQDAPGRSLRGYLARRATTHPPAVVEGYALAHGWSVRQHPARAIHLCPRCTRGRT